MFTRKDYCFFAIALIFVIAGFGCMVFDAAEHGFGIATLWIAPPFLLVGLLLPVAGIVGYPPSTRSGLMELVKANKSKHAFGLVTFLISITIYLITLEPTASLWDCSEFIACAYKLQVPHTPGNPLLLLIGRIFSMLSFGDVKNVAKTINAMSSLFSALAVYVVYYIIYAFAEKLIPKSTKRFTTLSIVSSLCGSLCLTVSDTFWFSAVEAETYGPACFFLVLLFGLILKGKNMEEPFRSRWLILIFYVAGLSYCIHPMCILSLPVLPFAWYSNRRSLTFKNGFLLLLAGMVIVVVINRLFSTGVFEFVFDLDLFLVNTMGFPFYSGVVVLLIAFIVTVWFVLKKYAFLKAYMWAVVFLLFGFIPYLQLFIRSNHNPPIDEGNPENLALIKAYMNRESYPSSPLLYGPYFDAQVAEVQVKKKIYFKGETKYELAGTMPAYVYEPQRNTILPRLYSNDPAHVAAYRSWTGLKQNENPKFSDNLTFLFKYQLGHMYLRYLLWNFAGRESDHQDCDWLRPWDSLHVSVHAEDENKARNQFWMIPLLVGLAGAYFHYKRDARNFYSTSIFFLITGLILALYLNSYPVEPRERDYIYVGSYMAFCIWIGVGVLALAMALAHVRLAVIGAIFFGIGTPLWMAFENFDDHNRAGRTFQIDNARNQLAGCARNSILFTGGDNDTFPFWYLQEVEGVRTDVRIMVLSYLNTDWYINSLRKTHYESQKFLLTLGEKGYRQYGINDVLYIHETIQGGIDLQTYLQLLRDEHKALRMSGQHGDDYSIMPSRALKLKTNKSSLVAPGESGNVAAEITIGVTGNYVQKSTLAILDIMATNNWRRPIYFNYTSLNSAGLALNTHVIQEGNLYRFSPIENKEEDIIVNTRVGYKNLLEDSDYSNLENPSLNFNYEDYQTRIINPLRMSFNSLAIAFLNEGNSRMADTVLTLAIKKLYVKHLSPSYTNLQAANILVMLGKKEQARWLCVSLFNFHYDHYESSIKKGDNADRFDVYLIQEAATLLYELGEKSYLLKAERIGF